MSDIATERPKISSERETSTSTTSFYRPELDVLRFVAFVMVFLFHLLPDKASRYPSVHSSIFRDIYASIACSMGFGVCLFFILSAFLITTLLLREREVTSSVNLLAFYRRRILRIWPLYSFALILAFLACSLSRGFPGYGVIAAYLLMAGNLLPHFHLSGDIRPLKIFHLWSISVEEQFYLVFPIIARSVKAKFLPILCCLLAMLALFSLLYLANSNATKEEIWQNSFVQFLMFAAGIGIAVLCNGRRLPQLLIPVRMLILLLGILACFSAQYFFRIGGEGLYVSASHALFGYLLAMLGCSTLLLAVLGFPKRLPMPLIYLGKISYGLYVFHVWCIGLAAFLVGSFFHISMAEGTGGILMVLSKDLLAFALTVTFAAISYHVVEKPFLRFKKKYEVVSTRSA